MTETKTQGHALTDLDHWAATRPNEPWLVDLVAGQEQPITWAEGKAIIETAAAGLASLLPGAGRKVAILSRNRAHWILADLAILRGGLNTVPVFTTMRADTFHYVLDFADVELLILGESANWQDVKAHVPEGLKIITLPGVDASEGDMTWDDLLVLGRTTSLPPMPGAEVCATIIFTSGTTGKPKGVMHSLGSLARATAGLVNETDTGTGWRFFSYLPLSHLAERLIIELHAINTGGTIYFNEGLESFASDLRIAEPAYFFGVPRIWEKLVQGVIAGANGDVEGLKAMLTGPNRDAVAAAIRDKLGLGTVKAMLTSTAPTPPATKEWFDLMGLSLRDGYGQTELLPIAVSPEGMTRHGAVGRVVEGVEVRITDEGELIARGPGCSLGYYKMPDKTAETFRDGWVHTGDRATMDDEGYITLRGRVKETFKTAKGKYVAPGPIETRILESEMVDQVCLVGHGLPQTLLICVPSETAFRRGMDAVEAHIFDLIAEVNEELERHARIGAILLEEDPWTIENGILTHTMKVRRERVLDRYEELIVTVAADMGTGQALRIVATR